MQGNKDMETPLPSCSRHIEQTDEGDILMISDQQTNDRKILPTEQYGNSYRQNTQTKMEKLIKKPSVHVKMLGINPTQIKTARNT
jgi:hypothetical protein